MEAFTRKSCGRSLLFLLHNTYLPCLLPILCETSGQGRVGLQIQNDCSEIVEHAFPVHHRRDSMTQRIEHEIMLVYRMLQAIVNLAK